MKRKIQLFYAKSFLLSERFYMLCLRISTRYKAIIKNNYLDSLLGEFKKNMSV